MQFGPGFNPSEQFESIATGHAQVRENRGRWLVIPRSEFAGQKLDGFLPIASDVNRVLKASFAQQLAQQENVEFLIFDDNEHPLCGKVRVHVLA